MTGMVEKLGPNLYKVGSLRVDTARREVTATGHVNDVTFLEFVACTPNGFKAYESALTIDANAIVFNTALLLIGLDPAHARVPVQHFDPIPPAGDPVELWVDWKTGDTPHHVRVEELLMDKRTNQVMPDGPWVYTGSTISDGRYFADIDGVLIGFVHSPSPIIENPRAGAVGAFGKVVLNTQLGLTPNTPVTLVIKALGPSTASRH